MPKSFILPLEVDTIDATTFTGALQKVTVLGGIAETCIILRIINDTSEDVEVSYDGFTINDYIPSGQTLQLDFQANAQPNANVAVLKKGTDVWVGSTAGAGTGVLYLTGYYQPE